MTVAASILDRLHALGFECTPDPPAIVLRYLHGPQPPPEALPVLEELRQNKVACLAALTAPRPLKHAADWPAVWDWTKAHRPDLYAAVDAALDRAFDDNEAWKLLPDAVQAAADAYRALPEAARQAVAT